MFSRKEKNVTLFYAKNENREDVYGFSAFSSSSTPTLDTSITTVTMIWKYIGEVIFNMLVLVGLIKGSDRIIKEIAELRDLISFVGKEKLYPLSVSLGYSRFDTRKDKSIDDLIKHCDKKLYDAKKRKA